MAKLFERKSTTLTISEFYESYKLEKYRFSVNYQRKSDVWSEDKKSFLIDSIFKNYPMPAIFLRPCVDTDTGKTVYDVVDGKQRLEAIISFIEDKIALTTYFSEDDFIDAANVNGADAISGLLFSKIKELGIASSDYVKQFWTYVINIEYLYEQNEGLVASVFDRLNRNGEPLTRQELRNAKYANSILLAQIKELAEQEFWNDKLARLKSVRMEDVEFISELFFLIIEDKILESSQDVLDELYEKYRNDQGNVEKARSNFCEVVDFISALDLDYAANKRLCWTTHLYTLFSAGWKLKQKGISPADVKDKLKSFYEDYFSRDTRYDGALRKYKDASSSRTRSEIQRRNRLEAVLGFCGIKLN